MPQTPTNALKRYSLVDGENTFASSAAMGESDFRKLQSLIPSLSGAMEREQALVGFTTSGIGGGGAGGSGSAFPSRVAFFHQYKRNNAGVVTTYWFCATATTLYQLSGYPGGVWNVVSQVGTLANFPEAININNQMRLSDGVSSWLFDGFNWVKEGLAIPLHAPTFKINSGGPRSHSITAVARANGVTTITVGLDTGTITSVTTTTVTGAGTSFASSDIGQIIYTVWKPAIGVARLVPTGVITAVGSTTSCTIQFIPLGAAGLVFQTGQGYIIGAPAQGEYANVAGVTDASFNGNGNLVVSSGGLTNWTFTFNQIAADASSSGGTVTLQVLSVVSNRYYWTTFSDQSATHPHESSSSPISPGTGVITNGTVQVFQRPGSTVTITGLTGAVVGSGTDWNQNDVGLTLYDTAGSAFVIQSVTDNQHLTVNTFAGNGSPGGYVIAPSRATHWNVYASSSEEDKIGNRSEEH